jgi:hypothetical protein
MLVRPSSERLTDIFRSIVTAHRFGLSCYSRCLEKMDHADYTLDNSPQ